MPPLHMSALLAGIILTAGVAGLRDGARQAFGWMVGGVVLAMFYATFFTVYS